VDGTADQRPGRRPSASHRSAAASASARRRRRRFHRPVRQLLQSMWLRFLLFFKIIFHVSDTEKRFNGFFFSFFLRRPIPNGGISQTVADWCRSMIGLGLVQSRSIITLPWTARPINSERKRENSVKRKSSKTSHCDRVDERGGFNSVIQSPDDVGKRQWPTPLR